jgi:hypothetical protein
LPSAANAPAIAVHEPSDEPGSASGKRPAALADRKIASWTDPRAVAALANDCSLKVTNPDTEEPDPLACDVPFEQSCVYDPCFEKGQTCKQGCSKKCASCDAACADHCATCRDACTDGACRQRCAASCGECKQSCLKSRDKCATAQCAQAELACGRAAKRAWAGAGCTGKCPEINECLEPCAADNACNAKCQKRFKGCDIEYCMTGAPPE